MKIQYRIRNDFIEIVRCFGTDSKVVLPDTVNGVLVCSVAAYAFSARKTVEEEDVQEYDTGDSFLTHGEEYLLAGNKIEEIVFPDTVKEIGNYIFYGCKELKKLEFSDTLTQIGSGAFTGCGKLKYLNVHLRRGKKSCVKDILGELWQRIDVTFLDETKDGESLSNHAKRTIQLVFPEHYEEAVENTPARILFTQHHGTGNNYRQCFYNKEMDYRKYDELFGLATAQDKQEVLVDLAFCRLRFPYELTERHEKVYDEYIRENLTEIIQYFVEQDDLERLRLISVRRLWSESALHEAVQIASAAGNTEMTGLLMDELHRLFPKKNQGKTGRKKRFEL